MTLFQAIILGIVQGLTEFLPVSSSAHLRIVPALFGWGDPGAAFSAIVQIGTLVAVLIYFAKDISTISGAVLSGILRGKPFETQEAKTGWMIVVGTIPIVVFGLLFKKNIETTFRSLYWISASLILLALVLSLAEQHVKSRQHKGLRGKTMAEIGWMQTIIIGLAQAVALIPGSSRSGVTITAGLFTNLNRETAARFSFLLSLPSVFAAAMLELYVTRHDIMASTGNMVDIAAATLVAGVVGYLSIAFLLNYLHRHTTLIFIVYRLIAGVGVIALLATGKLLP